MCDKITLLPEDDANWQTFTANVKPLRQKKVKPEIPVTKRRITKESPLIFPVKSLPPLAKKASVKTKKNEIDATLDLHGKTLAQAETVFIRFIQKAAQMGNRRLLIITGKGSAENTNTLRSVLPDWLNSPAIRPLVSSFMHAPQNLGGTGAYVVELKRQK